MDENKGITFGEKLGFIVGFIAIILAIFSLNKDILDRNFGYFSLGNILLIFGLILSVSLYFYSLNCIRFDYPILTRINSLKHFETIGNIFYSIAIFLYPLVIISLYVLYITINLVKEYIHINISNLSETLISGVFSSIISILFLAFNYRQQQKKERNFLKIKDEIDKEILNETNQNFINKEYNYIPIDLTNRIIEKLEKVIMNKYGLNSIKRIPKNGGVEFSLKEGIISKEDYIFIRNLRGIRHLCVHGNSNINITKEKAEERMNKTNKIISKLEKIT